jgi:hypothetical protein
MTRALDHLAKAAMTAATVIAACVPSLPGELDPQSTGAAGGMSGSGASGNAGQAPSDGGAGSSVLCDPECVPAPNCHDESAPTSSTISTFEHGCTHVDQVDGRSGGWFVAVSPSSTVTPAPNTPFVPACTGAAGTCFSACITGTLSGGPFPWALVGFAPRLNAAAYDASRYRGIAFDITGYIGAQSTVRFRVPLVADAMVGNGDGACLQNCYDSYTAVLPRAILQPGGWTHHEVLFSALHQLGYGSPEPWDPTTVISMQWEVAALEETLAGDLFMLCVDQVALLP